MNSFPPDKRFRISAFVLINVYLVGLIGIGMTNTTIQSYFLKLTALNLLLTAALLLWNHPAWSLKAAWVFLLWALSGYLVEVAGVHTGKIFGVYSYGPTLGFQIAGVPLIIGINWLLLLYSVAELFKRVQNNWLFSALGATVMTALDVLIEPVAIQLDFWQWEGGTIPMQNYFAWWGVAFLLLFLSRCWLPAFDNRMARVVLILQGTFFAALNLLLK